MRHGKSKIVRLGNSKRPLYDYWDGLEIQFCIMNMMRRGLIYAFKEGNLDDVWDVNRPTHGAIYLDG